MKKIFCILLALIASVCFSNIPAGAAEHGGKEHGGEEHESKKGSAKHGSDDKEHGGKEHGGKEHGGKEHGGAAIHAEPTADDIRSTMKTHVLEKSEETGTFDILDPEIGLNRKLELVRVHERVGKTGDYYYSCADFTDVNTGEMLDLDLDVEDRDGELSVVDVRIHKLNGKERYTYDEDDNRIPVSE